MNISIFCSSSELIDPIYFNIAKELGNKLLNLKWKMIYGGANCGLMRELADTILNGGGELMGIMPQIIVERGRVDKRVEEFIIVDTMMERKHQLREYADAFIVLPGGWGTMEEITEVITLKQLGEHNKPIVFLNVNGFYDTFFAFINQAVEEGFISPKYMELYFITSSVTEAIEYIRTYQPCKTASKY